MDAAPADGDGEHAGRVPRLDVVGRVSDVRRLGRVGLQTPKRLEQRVGIGLVPLGVICADHDVHRLAELREAIEREADRAETLRGDDPEPAVLASEHGQQAEDVVEGLQLGVERLVVEPVRLDQLVDAVRVEVAHLGDEPGAADRGADELLVRLPPEHGERRVLHRREDDRPRVDQRAVEVEEDDAEAHQSIVAASSYSTRSRYRPQGGAVRPASERGLPSSRERIRSGASRPASSIVPASVRTM